MDPEFWHRRWEKQEIGFHESEGNHLLKHYFSTWSKQQNSRVFVPLCGKTRDIAWLLSRGVDVVAIELNQQAVEALFSELGLKPTPIRVECDTSLLCYASQGIKVYVGDFFALSPQLIGNVDTVYDRGALVALPQDLRVRYSKHLLKISAGCEQFIVAYDYDQNLFKGPPFSVTFDEILFHYKPSFASISQLHRAKVEGGFRGHQDVFENAYLLK